MKPVAIPKSVAINRIPMATNTNLTTTHNLEPLLSTDWTKLPNILKRSGGGFSHTRKPAG